METDIVKRPPPEPEKRIKDTTTSEQTPKPQPKDIKPKVSKADKKLEVAKNDDEIKPTDTPDKDSPSTPRSNSPTGAIIFAIIICIILIALVLYAQLS